MTSEYGITRDGQEVGPIIYSEETISESKGFGFLCYFVNKETNRVDFEFCREISRQQTKEN